MSPDKRQGTIPLDDMRSRPLNGHAILRKERKAPKSVDMEMEDEPEEKVKDKKLVEPEGMTEDREMRAPPIEEEDLLDFSMDEMAESTPEPVPAKRYDSNIPLPSLDGAHSDDDDDDDDDDDEFGMSQGRMPGSIYTSTERFSTTESENFTSRRRLSDSVGQQDGLREHPHLTGLRDTVARLTAEKEAARKEAERAVGQVEELKHLLDSDMEKIVKDAESLSQEIKKLKEQNSRLKDELNDAQSHIFSLQPYRKDLTSEEVGRQYDELVQQIQDWVQKFMDPWLEDYEAGVEALGNNVRKQSGEAAKFKRTLQRYPDLVHGALFPETDEDIIVAIIMRYLNDNIFQKILYGSVQNYTEMISFIETQMQSAVEPKRDLFTVRTWTGEGYNALINAPPFKSVRSRRCRDMTMELASIFQIFCKKERYQWFCQNMEEHCIKPAMALCEKLQVSTNHFYIDIQPYISWGPGSRFSLSAEFIENIDNLDCKNILQNRKAFNMAKMDPRPTKGDLHQELMNVCTVIPALHIRQIGQRDAIRPPAIVRKQQMLVAWGSEEKREKFVDVGDQSLVSHLYLSKERRKGEGWWPGG